MQDLLINYSKIINNGFQKYNIKKDRGKEKFLLNIVYEKENFWIEIISLT